MGNIFKSIQAGVNTTVRGIFGYREDFRDERNFYLAGDNIKFGNFEKRHPIEKGYNYNTNVYSIINRIAQIAAEVPIEICRHNAKGELEVVEKGDFHKFIHKPNPKANYKDMTFEAMIYQLANGNIMEYFLKPATFSIPDERYILAPQYMKIDAREVFHGYEPTKYRYHFGKKEYSYEPEEILHVKRFNPDISSIYPCYGLSPLQAAFRTLVASNEILLSEASVIKNRGISGFITSKAKRALTNDEKTMAEDALKKRIGGGDKFGKIALTSGNLDYVSIGMSPTDLQLLESGLMRKRDLCSVYGVSSKMFNDPEGSTYNNVKTDDKKLYTDAVLPPLSLYIDAINKTYAPMFKETDGDVYVRIKTEDINALQEDEQKVAHKQRSKMETLTKVLEGIPEKWSENQAITMLMEILDINEEEAKRYVKR